MKIINDSRDMLLGSDGKMSSRKISAFILLLLFVYMGIKFSLTQPSQEQVNLATIVIISNLLLNGVITAQNIISIIKSKNKEKE